MSSPASRTRGRADRAVKQDGVARLPGRPRKSPVRAAELSRAGFPGEVWVHSVKVRLICRWEPESVMKFPLVSRYRGGTRKGRTWPRTCLPSFDTGRFRRIAAPVGCVLNDLRRYPGEIEEGTLHSVRLFLITTGGLAVARAERTLLAPAGFLKSESRPIRTAHSAGRALAIVFYLSQARYKSSSYCRVKGNARILRDTGADDPSAALHCLQVSRLLRMAKSMSTFCDRALRHSVRSGREPRPGRVEHRDAMLSEKGPVAMARIGLAVRAPSIKR